VIPAVNRHFAIALKELRTGVTVCCWLIGVALLVQVIAWSLLSFTDIRYDVYQAKASGDQSQVLTAEEIRRQAVRDATTGDEGVVTADVNRQLSKADRILGMLTSLAGAVGTMGVLALLPLLGLGVILAAGTATAGVEKASGAFVWAVVLVILAVPWGSFFTAVPFDGLFTDYGAMTHDTTQWRLGIVAGEEASPTGRGVLFFGRWLVLPLAGVAGIAAIGLRFRSGVEAGLIPKEDLRLDPELEREVARIKATSLVGGGRTAGALRNTMGNGDAGDEEDKPATKPPPPDPARSIRQPSPGQPLSRPI